MFISLSLSLFPCLDLPHSCYKLVILRFFSQCFSFFSSSLITLLLISISLGCTCVYLFIPLFLCLSPYISITMSVSISFSFSISLSRYIYIYTFFLVVFECFIFFLFELFSSLHGLAVVAYTSVFLTKPPLRSPLRPQTSFSS